MGNGLSSADLILGSMAGFAAGTPGSGSHAPSSVDLLLSPMAGLLGAPAPVAANPHAPSSVDLLLTPLWGTLFPAVATGTVEYNVYWDEGEAIILYGEPIGTTDGTTFVFGPLDDGVYEFAVRAFDSGSGLEERNTDAVARLVVLDGQDETARPNPVASLSARPIAGGKIEVRWAHVAEPGRSRPESFAIRATPGTTPDPGTTPGLLLRANGQSAYLATISGLGAGPHAVTVRAVAGGLSDGGTLFVVVHPDLGAPSAPEDLVIVITDSDS